METAVTLDRRRATPTSSLPAAMATYIPPPKADTPTSRGKRSETSGARGSGQPHTHTPGLFFSLCACYICSVKALTLCVHRRGVAAKHQVGQRKGDIGQGRTAGNGNVCATPVRLTLDVARPRHCGTASHVVHTRTRATDSTATPVRPVLHEGKLKLKDSGSLTWRGHGVV